MLKVDAIHAFQDNYIWCIDLGSSLAVVDPGDGEVVINYLENQHKPLTHILVTHWHPDHIGGINKLQDTHKNTLEVIGPKSSKIKEVNHIVQDQDLLAIAEHQFRVIEIPGHTLEHIAFWEINSQSLFCGDTLFAAGCGRVFEGTFEQMQNSLSKLSKLPVSTNVYCAHEYTLSNISFALAVEPNNASLIQFSERCITLRERDEITLPTKLEQELTYNPFLRCSEESVIEAALNQGASSTSPTDVFATLRQWKDEF